MSDDLGMLLRTAAYLAFEDGTNDYTTPALAAARIAELKAALQKILNPHRPKMQGMPRRVIIQEIALMQEIARAALAGGEDR